MRQIFPYERGALADDVDLAVAYAYPPARWWLRANMVASTDGAATLQGRTCGLSGEADHRLFALLRSLADIVVVGAETVRAEGYGPARVRSEWAPLRDGLPPTPVIAVVTRRIDLDLSSRLFTEAPAHARTIVVTTAAASHERRAQAAARADVVIAGEELVDLKAALAALARRGFRRVLTEGGPRLLGQLVMAGLLDELCLTVSPLLAGGDASRITTWAALASPQRLELAHVLEAGGSLFCRYVMSNEPTKLSDDSERQRAGEAAMPVHRKTELVQEASEICVNPVYVQLADEKVPKYQLPQTGMLPDTALQVVRDELILDGSSRLNLATFVTTWMEPQADRLMAECFDKNMIDKDEYPQTSELERRCVSILADLWHAPAGSGAPGCSTTGSSEACMLGGMALLWRWRARQDRGASGPPGGGKPNLVMGANVQVCWEKFCRYWQVEPRMVPMERDRLHLRGPQAAAACDENTIGVVAIMGSTMDGSYEPVAEIGQALDALQAQRGLDIPLHVDAASGGFVAPFLHQDLAWDFRVPRVQSINASGHKYGLVYPGVGWIVWREAGALPDDLVFRVNYLGGDMPTFALNFSRPGGHVAAQYYNFLRLGFQGYQRIHQACQDIALRLSAEIAKMGPFELLTEGRDLPVFAFKLRDDAAGGYSVFDVAERLRQRGWLVPAYTFPANLENTAVIRIVVRNGFSADLADLLLDDIRRHSAALGRHPHPNLPLVTPGRRQTFAH